ncbi:hypothetical protein BJV82DRAFT_579030 [Fennellomyces sp. T-0311]|nr:hypothetical protein BJV82DRAFT_579030 [Fennellomyces sp. T-0311]
MEPATLFPIYDLDTDLVKNTFRKVGPALDARKYEQAIGFASTTLCKVQEFLMVTLDHRSHALGKQARFEEAEKDAQEMITFQPTVAKGYLRLGDLYQMQGKQRRAIDAYNNALQKVSADHPHYTQIINCKEQATRENETRVNFVAKFPVELVGEIVMLLPENSKSAFWSVCSEWRIKVSKCSTIWEKMTSGDGTKADWTTSVMPHIAIHVKDLTINTKNRGVFLHYLRTMKDGKFRKLKSLKMNGKRPLSSYVFV